MSRRTKAEIAVTLMLGICVVMALPWVELLPASTRAWRRAREVLLSIWRLIFTAAAPSLAACTASFLVEAAELPPLRASLSSVSPPLLC